MTAMPSWLTPMALPVIGDIHGDFAALQHVTMELNAIGVVRAPLILGDLFWTMDPVRSPRAVLEFLMHAPCERIVRGNTEDYLVGGRLDNWAPSTPDEEIEKQIMLGFRDSLSARERSWIESLPTTYRFMYGGRRCLATHASPANMERGLVLNASRPEWMSLLDSSEIDVIVTGHLHRGFAHLVNRIAHLCVGAIGRHKRDYDGIVDYAILDQTPSGLVMLYQRTRVTSP
jgi:predicted phosphodiesterase